MNRHALDTFPFFAILLGMEEMSLKEGISLVKRYNKMTPKERDQIKRQRFYAMVTFARKHNPLYAKLYQNLGVNFFMRDVPYVERDYLIANRKNWLSDETVPMPVNEAINTVRSFSYDSDYARFLLHGSRYVIISSTDGALQQAAWSKSTSVLSVFLPIEDMVARLNELRPAFLWAYPSTLEKLLEQKRLGTLSISPVLIIAGGESLSDELRASLIDAFDSTVQATYSSAEFGIVASECQMGHLHVNDDWIIIEKADVNGKPCAEGDEPDKFLITNMFKTDYPIIRMTLPDSVYIHDKPCPCGNPSPWISITSAKDDIIRFIADNGEDVSIHIDEFSSVLKDVKGLTGYQILIYTNNSISVRMEVDDNSAKGILFLQAEQIIRRFLKDKKITASTITLDADTPLRNEQSGKLKNVLDCRD